MRAIVIALLVMLAACGAGADVQAPPAGPIVIRDNPGGNVHQFLAERARLERSGRPVELRGHIASAAVVFVTLPNACLGRGALLRFHGASGGWPDLAERRIAGVLRGDMRQQWLTVWRHSREWSDVTAAEAVRLDPQIRICGG